jgi:hypothetical protein
MRTLATLLVALAFAAAAHANPALHGTWSATIDGQPLVVTFDAGGSGKVNATPMQWQARGKQLVVRQQGSASVSYSYEVKGDKLSVDGGDLAGRVTLTRGKPAAAKAASANGRELVGKWCRMSSISTSSRGGSERSTCFELKADGTYTYQHEGSMSGAYGSTASQSSDSGRWKASGGRLTAHSRTGAVNVYTLEKRNHPTNKRDPMICLNGECYVTFYNKPAW